MCIRDRLCVASGELGCDGEGGLQGGVALLDDLDELDALVFVSVLERLEGRDVLV